MGTRYNVSDLVEVEDIDLGWPRSPGIVTEIIKNYDGTIYVVEWDDGTIGRIPASELKLYKRGEDSQTKVISGPSRQDEIDGWDVHYAERIILRDGDVIWKGEISDIGAGSEFDYEKGSAFGYGSYDNFSTGEDLCKRFKITTNKLILGDVYVK